jgi:PPOX class probable F420-dependent enzyme
MDLERGREFLRTNHRTVMATHHPDGRLQLSPVLVALDDAGRAVVSTRETAVKVRNLLRHPRVSFCAMTERFFGDWLQIEGEAEVLRLPEAMEPLVDYYRRISGEHPDWDDYRQAMVRDHRLVARLRPTRAYGMLQLPG